MINVTFTYYGAPLSFKVKIGDIDNFVRIISYNGATDITIVVPEND